MWAVSTIIQGLLSFMSSEDVTAGSVATDEDTRRHLARRSLATNVKNKLFVQLFPDLVQLHKERQSNGTGAAAAAAGASGGSSTPAPAAVPRTGEAARQPKRRAQQAAAPATTTQEADPGVCGTGIDAGTLFVGIVLLFVALAMVFGEDSEGGA